MAWVLACATTPDAHATGGPPTRVVAQQGFPPGDGTNAERTYVDAREDRVAVAHGRWVQLWGAVHGRWLLLAESRMAAPVLDVALVEDGVVVATRGGVLRLRVDGTTEPLALDPGDDEVFLVGAGRAAAIVTPTRITSTTGATRALPDGRFPIDARSASGRAAAIVELEGGERMAWSLPDLEPIADARPLPGPPVQVAEDGAVTIATQRVAGRATWTWLAAGDGVWCVGGPGGGRCFASGLASTREIGPSDAVALLGGAPLVSERAGLLQAGRHRPLPPVNVLAASTAAIAGGADRGRLYVLEADDQPAELSVGAGMVTGLAWSSNNGRLATANIDGHVYVLDMAARDLRLVGTFEQPALAVAWSTANRLIVALDGAPAQLLDLGVAAPRWSPLPWAALSVAVSPAGAIARVTTDGTVIVSAGGTERVVAGPVGARTVAWIDGDTLAWIGDTAGAAGVGTGAWRQVVHVGDTWGSLEDRGATWGPAALFHSTVGG